MSRKKQIECIKAAQTIIATARLGIHPNLALAKAALQNIEHEQKQLRENGVSATSLECVRTTLACVANGHLPTAPQCIQAVIALHAHESGLDPNPETETTQATA